MRSILGTINKRINFLPRISSCQFLLAFVMVSFLGLDVNAQNRKIVNPSFETGTIVPHTNATAGVDYSFTL